jgi:16S rRNA (uracil1498-N3)-methyltransferase
MPRFFIENISGGFAEITGEDAKHIGFSLRMKTGDPITLCCNAVDYYCEVTSITPEIVTAKILSSEKCKAEPSVWLTLYQAVPKLDKLEYIIQKAVELGASEIVPVLTKRCVSRPEEKDFAKKLIRYKKISLEAAKQSGRGIVPEIKPLIKLDKALKNMSESDFSFVLYEKGGIRFSESGVQNAEKVSILIGSEGGFEADEIEAAKQYGVKPLWLGDRILRCETAPLAAISVVMFLTQNL